MKAFRWAYVTMLLWSTLALGGDASAQTQLIVPIPVTAVQTGPRLTVLWSPASGVTDPYAVTFHRGDGSANSEATRVATFSVPSTSIELAIPPGISGTFAVAVVGSRAGSRIAEGQTTFTIGADCTGPPAAPTGLTGVRIARTANIRANASRLASSYTLLAGTVSNGTNLFNGSIGNVSVAGSNNVDPSIPLFIRLFAVNSCGASPPSAELVLPPGDGVGCAPDPTTLCLFNGRFVANLNQRLPDGTLVPAAVTRRFNDGGGFTFDGATENVFLRFSDQCRATGRYEVTFTNRSGFPASTGFELFVGDQLGSTSRLFQHPAGTPFVSFTDSTSFRCGEPVAQ